MSNLCFGAPMKYIAFFATTKPQPGHTYAGIPVAGETVFIRALDVTEHTDPLEAASGMELPGETLLNTFEAGE